MKFTLSTKPLKNAMALGIIKANISKYYYLSNIVQITATQDTLKLNIVATGIKTRMTLHGSGEANTTASIMVDCSKFKSLIESIETDVITLDFIDGSLYVRAGSSKFAIPQMLDVEDVQLTEPIDITAATSSIAIKPANWQFIKDHQLYAISTSEKFPVYTNAWVSGDNEVLIGDYGIGMFTYSKFSDFGSTCLLPPSLVNLFTSIPEGSMISKIDKDYVLIIETDSYSMVTEFTPRYEEDESVGSYNAPIILGRMEHPEDFVTIDVSPIIKFINQTSILNQSDADKFIQFTIEDGKLTLASKSNTYTMDVATQQSYTVKFVTDFIKSVISNFDTDQVNVAPMSGVQVDDNGNTVERTVGCIFWTDKLTAILAGHA